MSKEIINTPESIKAAADAISYTLRRIQADENCRAHMGPFTEVFNRLTKAHSLLTGEDQKEIENGIRDYPLSRMDNYTKVSEIRQIVDDLCDGAPDANSTAKLANQIAEICRK